MNKLQTITLISIVAFGAILYLWRKNEVAVARFIAYRVLKIKPPHKCIPIEVSNSGMTTVKLENIQSINEVDWNKTLGFPTKIPLTVLRYIRTLSGTRIAHGALYAGTSEKRKQENEDTRRGLTLASCIYQINIPASSVLIDDLTKQYLYILLADARPIKVVPPSPLFFFRKVSEDGETPYLPLPSDEDMQKYMDMTVQIGAVLLIFADLPMYPPRISFYEELKTRAGAALRQINRRLPTEEEMFSMVTAFAYYTELPIPQSYFVNSPLASHLVNELRYRHKKPPKLTIVKNEGK